MDAVEPWFGDESGRDSQEQAFLRRLRAIASTWQHADLTPDDSSLLLCLNPLVVQLEVPNLPISWRFLRVSFWTGGASGWELEGCWEDDHIEGPSGNDAETLIVRGVVASPEQYAEWTAAWLSTQLTRPIVRQEWLRGEEVVATRWRLTDTDADLQRTGPFLFGYRRREPDRTVRIR